MTERRAARLGLKIDATRRAITGSSGQAAGFRTAIAKAVDIGGTRFRNVSFAVIEGTGPLADVDAGIVGMPILLALGVIRWSPDGVVEVGSPAPRVRADAEPRLRSESAAAADARVRPRRTDDTRYRREHDRPQCQLCQHVSASR